MKCLNEPFEAFRGCLSVRNRARNSAVGPGARGRTGRVATFKAVVWAIKLFQKIFFATKSSLRALFFDLRAVSVARKNHRPIFERSKWPPRSADFAQRATFPANLSRSGSSESHSMRHVPLSRASTLIVDRFPSLKMKSHSSGKRRNRRTVRPSSANSSLSAPALRGTIAR